MQLKAAAKSITLTENYVRGLPRLWADERAVRQIALNLLSNAVKFTPSGGEIAIRVGWANAGGQFLSIRDNGPRHPRRGNPDRAVPRSARAPSPSRAPSAAPASACPSSRR